MGGYHHEKLGLKIFSCASLGIIPDTAGTTSDPAGKNTDTRSSKSNQASCTTNFSHPLISSIFVPIFIPRLSFSTIITEHKVKSSLSISPCHDDELTLITASTEYSIHQVHHTLSKAYTIYSIHRVQHTPSTAYTEYSIHWVQHTPSTAYTEYSIHWVQHTPKIVCLPFILTIMSWPLNVAWASGMPPYTIDCHQPALHDSSKVQSPHHIPTVAS